MAAGFWAYAVRSQVESGNSPRYSLSATFLSSDGLQVGADVRLAGVKVGTVAGITLDPKTFMTDVDFRIEDRYRLPADTSIGIGSSGLTARNALLVSPGHSDRTLGPGEVVRRTREMVSLEQAVSQYIFGTGGLDLNSGH